MAVPKTGERLRCPQCGTEVVVVRAPGDEPRCCDRPLEPNTGQSKAG